jgi:hypothetical protein
MSDKKITGPGAGISPTPTLAAQAEAVFESYLTARVVNARREVAAAKAALLGDARDRHKLEVLRRAENNLEKLQAQLVEQKANTNRARARAANPDAPSSAEPADGPCLPGADAILPSPEDRNRK